MPHVPPFAFGPIAPVQAMVCLIDLAGSHVPSMSLRAMGILGSYACFDFDPVATRLLKDNFEGSEVHHSVLNRDLDDIPRP